MKAVLLLNERVPQGGDSFTELRVYRVPSSVAGSAHDLKYSFTTPAALIADFWRDVDQWKGLK